MEGNGETQLWHKVAAMAIAIPVVLFFLAMLVILGSKALIWAIHL